MSFTIAENIRTSQLSQTAPVAPSFPSNSSKPICSKIAPAQRGPSRDTGCGFVAETQLLDAKLTAEVNLFRDASHQAAMKKTERDVKKILTEEIKGIKIWSTGSLPAGVELHSSDLDLSIKIPGSEGSSMRKLWRCRGILAQWNTFKYFHVQPARIPVLSMVHRETGVEIDVTIDNDDGKRNTQLLVWYGQIDTRFVLLSKAVKDWAKCVGVGGAKRGGLNSFALCLMVIHYLQVGVNPAVLPNLQEIFPELIGNIVVEDDNYQKRNLREELEKRGHEFEVNESSVGARFVGFLKYYASFDFTSNWISVRQGKVMRKSWDEKNEPMDGMPRNSRRIVIQDPFIKTGWNCAASVWEYDRFERIIRQFGLSYEKILQSRSIFPGVSVARRRIEEAGKRRDMQIIQWKTEIAEGRPGKISFNEKWEITEDAVWENKEAWRPPYHGYQAPDNYWQL